MKKEDLDDVVIEEENLNDVDNKDVIDEDEVVDEEIIDEDVTDETDETNELESDESLDSPSEDSKVIELEDRLVRLQADFNNYKRRTEAEKKEYVTLGVKKLAMDILPVLDTLSLALVSVAEHTEDKSLIEGFDLIDDQLIDVLKKHEIVEIEAEGQKFDPNFHYAVGVVEDSDLDSDRVVDVLQKGYKIKDEVIRPAMVRVSK